MTHLRTRRRQGEEVVLQTIFILKYLLPMPRQPAVRDNAGSSDVPLEDEPVPRAWGEHISIPGKSPNTCCVAIQDADPFTAGHIPHLHQPFVCSHCHLVALHTHTTYIQEIVTSLHQLAAGYVQRLHQCFLHRTNKSLPPDKIQGGTQNIFIQNNVSSM